MKSTLHSPLNGTVADVTARIVERSAASRSAYLRRIRAAADRGPARGQLACANLAHGFAASDDSDKQALRGHIKPNLAIVTSYNDMLSAHQPYGDYPAVLKKAVIRAGGIAQVAGGVPAMCDGITQGRDGMQLSLYSRDVIAMSTAIALSHDMFDGALMLGVCDKIVPGLLIGALSFGHLPTVFVPAGPMASGLPNGEKARVRQLYAEGKVGRDELLEAEAASYHSKGTCTFYGTANSNQLLMEVLGLHLPGSSFVNPGTPLRDALTRAAAERAVAITRQGGELTPIGELVDEKAIVNACVALLASGGSTNHTLHLVAIARAAGIALTWNDLSDLSAAVPLLARVYPNGSADVNHFHAAGGVGFLIHTLLRAGLMHDDVLTISGRGLSRTLGEPMLRGDNLTWEEGTKVSHDLAVLRPADEPFATDGGMKVLHGPLGTGVIKVSAVAPEHRVVTAPAIIFDDQGEFLQAFVGRPARRRRLRGGDPLPGSGRQRHAGAAQAHALARRTAGPRAAGRHRHRRPDVRRVRQGARRHPCHSRGGARWTAVAGARRRRDHGRLRARPARHRRRLRPPAPRSHRPRARGRGVDGHRPRAVRGVPGHRRTGRRGCQHLPGVLRPHDRGAPRGEQCPGSLSSRPCWTSCR